MATICGFYAVNKKHCMNGNHCIVCNYNILDEAVRKTVKEYGETLRLLSKE